MTRYILDVHWKSQLTGQPSPELWCTDRAEPCPRIAARGVGSSPQPGEVLGQQLWVGSCSAQQPRAEVWL